MWNDCKDTGRGTCRNCSIIQGVPVDHSSHLQIPVAMSSGDAEYKSATTAWMRVSLLQMLLYDLKYLYTSVYAWDKLNQDPTEIIIDNGAAICMTQCSKDTAGNMHDARHFFIM